MNLPNQITVGRLLLTIVLFVLLGTICGPGGGAAWYVAFALFIVTALSDGLDGYLARSRGEVTAFGRIADPFADKILICGVLVLLNTNPATSALVPSWIVIIVLAREYLVSGLRGYIEGHGKEFSAQWEGKTKLVIQAIYCGTLLFYPGNNFTWTLWVARIGLWATLIATVYSGYIYVRRAAGILRAGTEV